MPPFYSPIVIASQILTFLWSAMTGATAFRAEAAVYIACEIGDFALHSYNPAKEENVRSQMSFTIEQTND